MTDIEDNSISHVHLYKILLKMISQIILFCSNLHISFKETCILVELFWKKISSLKILS